MKAGNDQRNNFMINLHERYVAELGFEVRAPGSAVGCATNCAMKPGLLLIFIKIAQWQTVQSSPVGSTLFAQTCLL